MLQKLVDEKQGHVVSVGKIADIYANCGITKKVKATGLDALFDATLKEMKEAGDKTIVFTNFVDFDSSWGHRRDIAGYAAGLELFDRRLPELMELVGEDDTVNPSRISARRWRPTLVHRRWTTVKTCCDTCCLSRCRCVDFIRSPRSHS